MTSSRQRSGGPERLGRAIATRELRDDRGKTVTVRIAAPTADKQGDWICEFQIEGLGRKAVRSASGIDALQALMMAFEGIRVEIMKSKRPLQWVGGEPGDPGFPRQVPSYFGLAFSKKIEHIIDSEVEKFSADATSGGKRGG